MRCVDFYVKLDWMADQAAQSANTMSMIWFNELWQWTKLTSRMKHQKREHTQHRWMCAVYKAQIHQSVLCYGIFSLLWMRINILEFQFIDFHVRTVLNRLVVKRQSFHWTAYILHFEHLCYRQVCSVCFMTNLTYLMHLGIECASTVRRWNEQEKLEKLRVERKS